jgi:carboxypeptidase family protein
MHRSLLALISTCALAMAIASPAICEDLVGTVANSAGHAVQGVKIVARSADGKISEAATSDAGGRYRIAGLGPGRYFITLDPAGTGVQGQTVASYLGSTGLTVNWSVGPGISPLASAAPGAQLGAPTSVSVAGAVPLASSGEDTPGCKGQPGPPCGPKKSPSQ